MNREGRMQIPNIGALARQASSATRGVRRAGAGAIIASPEYGIRSGESRAGGHVSRFGRIRAD
jgi:hypothetical protein